MSDQRPLGVKVDLFRRDRSAARTRNRSAAAERAPPLSADSENRELLSHRPRRDIIGRRGVLYRTARTTSRAPYAFQMVRRRPMGGRPRCCTSACPSLSCRPAELGAGRLLIGAQTAPRPALLPTSDASPSRSDGSIDSSALSRRRGGVQERRDVQPRPAALEPRAPAADPGTANTDRTGDAAMSAAAEDRGGRHSPL